MNSRHVLQIVAAAALSVGGLVGCQQDDADARVRVDTDADRLDTSRTAGGRVRGTTDTGATGTYRGTTGTGGTYRGTDTGTGTGTYRGSLNTGGTGTTDTGVGARGSVGAGGAGAAGTIGTDRDTATGTGRTAEQPGLEGRIDGDVGGAGSSRTDPGRAIDDEDADTLAQPGTSGTRAPTQSANPDPHEGATSPDASDDRVGGTDAGAAGGDADVKVRVETPEAGAAGDDAKVRTEVEAPKGTDVDVDVDQNK